jgi:hypothetical protein
VIILQLDPVGPLNSWRFWSFSMTSHPMSGLPSSPYSGQPALIVRGVGFRFPSPSDATVVALFSGHGPISPVVEDHDLEHRVTCLDVCCCDGAIDTFRAPGFILRIETVSFAGAKLRNLLFDPGSRLHTTIDIDVNLCKCL